MELRILAKNTSYLILPKIVKFLVGLVRSKLIAVLLGTTGAGVIAQLTSIVQQMSNFALMSVNDGLVKQIAEKKEEVGFAQILSQLLKSYVLIIFFLTVISSILLYIFSEEITIFIFGDIQYYDYFLIGLLSFPILVINSISFALLKGFKEIKYISRSELIVIVVNILIFLPLIYFFGLTGAVIYVPISLLTILIINQYYANSQVIKRLSINLKAIFISNISKESVKELFIFAGVGLSTGSALVVSEIASRAVVVNYLGIDQLGLYSPLISWANLFTGFILPSVSTYLYPRFSEAKTKEEISGILNDAIRFITFLMIPFLFISIPIRYQIIPLFYSEEFLSAGDYLPWHFLGVLFYLLMYALGSVLTPTGKVRIHGAIYIVISMVDFGVVFYFVPIFGLYGWLLKFLVSPIIFFIFFLAFLKYYYAFKLLRKNLVLISYIIVGFFSLIFTEYFVVSNKLILFLLAVLLVFFSILVLTKNEKELILNKIRRVLS